MATDFMKNDDLSEQYQFMDIDNSKSLPDIVFKKSNVVIGAKYKANLLENKILAIAMSRIQENQSGEIVAQINAFEIKDFMGYKGNSIYQRLKTVAAQMGGRVFFFEDEERTRWSMQSLVIGAEYERNSGVFKIFFNNKLKKFLVNLKSSYANLYLPLLLSFKSDHSFRLYEWLKSKCYTPKGAPVKDVYIIETSLNELKVTIGMINTDTDKVKAAMLTSDPDFDYIVEKLAIEEAHSQWSAFKRYVLDIAIKEINNNPMSDIEVSYEAKKGGVGAKVRKLVFVCKKRNINIKKEENVSTEEDKKDIISIIEEIEDNIDIPMKTKDIRAVLEAAGYDRAKFYGAYDMLKKTKNVKNVTGWLISAINNNFSDSVSYKSNGSSKMSFNSFEQRQDYNFDELEAELLDN